METVPARHFCYHPGKMANWISAFFTVISAFATIVYIVLTAGLWKGTKRSADAATTSAEATKKSADAAAQPPWPPPNRLKSQPLFTGHSWAYRESR